MLVHSLAPSQTRAHKFTNYTHTRAHTRVHLHILLVKVKVIITLALEVRREPPDFVFAVFLVFVFTNKRA